MAAGVRRGWSTLAVGWAMVGLTTCTSSVRPRDCARLGVVFEPAVERETLQAMKAGVVGLIEAPGCPTRWLRVEGCRLPGRYGARALGPGQLDAARAIERCLSGTLTASVALEGPGGHVSSALLPEAGCEAATHALARVLLAPSPGGCTLSATASEIVPVPDLAATGGMDATEVTVAEYAACVRAEACEKVPPRDGCTTAEQPRHPRNCVTWRQARAFCAWAQGRLPTRDEWRAAIVSEAGVVAFPWPPPRGAANLADAVEGERHPFWSILPAYGDGFAGPAPVGAVAADRGPFGHADLLGNVAEWTSTRAGRGFRKVMGATFGTGRAPAEALTAGRVYAEGTASRYIGMRCFTP